MSIGRDVLKVAFIGCPAHTGSVELWFTPKRWVTVLRSQAALTFETLGLYCVAVLHTSFLEALLPVIAARECGGDPP